MNKDDIQDVLVGLAVVALGYALFKHFKPGAVGAGMVIAAPAAPYAASYPLATNNGVPYDTANPGQFIRLADLLRGTVHDIVTGDTRGNTPSTIYEIGQSAIEQQYPGSTTPYRNGDSVIRTDAYW